MRSTVRGVLTAFLVFSMMVPIHVPGLGRVTTASVAEAAPPPPGPPSMDPSKLMPGFGAQPSNPRMLVIVDTSRSMRFYPDNTATSMVDFSSHPPGGSGPFDVTAAEHGTISIACAPGQRVEVAKAYYGRTGPNHLPVVSPATAPVDDTTGCNVGASTPSPVTHAVTGWLDVTSVAQATCSNQQSCSIVVENSNLQGDPCSGKPKDAWVNYSCVPDVCPPGAGSKFCFAKKALHEVIKNNAANANLTNPTEFAVGGYSQFDYYPHIDATPSNYTTSCRYDTVLKAGVPSAYTSYGDPSYWTANSGSTPELDPGHRAGSPGTLTGGSYSTFSCDPETDPAFQGLPIYHACSASQPSKTCRKYWNRGFTSQILFQNALCKTAVPGGGSPWTWTGGCQPADLDADHQFINNNTASYWMAPEMFVRASAFGGACTAAPTWFTDVTNTVSPSGSSVPGGLPWPAGDTTFAGSASNCSAGTPCAFQLASTAATSTSIRNVTVYNTSYGPASSASPVTIGSPPPNTYNAGPAAQSALTVVLNPADLGGSCPGSVTPGYSLAVPGTFSWSTDPAPGFNGSFTATDFSSAASFPNCTVNGGCDVSATTAKTLYTCPSGFTPSVTTPTTNSSLTCNQVNYMHVESGVGPLAGKPGVTSAWAPSTSDWIPFTYTVDLTTYTTQKALGIDLCPSTTSTVWSSSSYPSAAPGVTPATGLPCGGSTDPLNGGWAKNSGGSSQCSIKALAAPTVRTDTGVMVCNAGYFWQAYSRTATPGQAKACLGTVTPQRYDFNEDRCSYRRFRFAWNETRFTYRWESNAGDYGGTFDVASSYPNNVAANHQYCGGAPTRAAGADPLEPYTESNSPNTGGFSYQYAPYSSVSPYPMPSSQAACPASLAPGTPGCSSTRALRCKLRWSSDPSAATNRFGNVAGFAPFQLATTPATLAPGAPDRIGCALNDPGPHDYMTRSVLPTSSDWCATTNQSAYVADSWSSTGTRIADFYTSSSSFSNSPASRDSWPTLWNGANPFASTAYPHASNVQDKFCVADETGAQVCTTAMPSDPFPAGKATGLSLMPTTYAGGATTAQNTSFNFGMTFSRWRRQVACSVPSDCTTLGVSSTCVSHVCTDPDFVDRSQAVLDAYDAITNPWGLRMPDQGDITPLAGSLQNAADYIKKTMSEDAYNGCRDYSVVLITDGLEDPESFGGVVNDPVQKVSNIVALNPSHPVKVYVVGFGVSGGVLDQMAVAGGTAVAGSAYNANDYASLQVALTKILNQQNSGTWSRSKPTLSTAGDRIYSAYFAVDPSKTIEFKGFLDAYPVVSGAVSASPAWKFDQVLNGNLSSDFRKLYTRQRGTTSAVAFDTPSSGLAALCIDMCSAAPASSCSHSGSCTGSDSSYVDKVIEFVRNDRSGTHAGFYYDKELRETRIGDIFYSQPVPIGPPNQPDVWASASTVPPPNNDGHGGVGSFDPVKFGTAYRTFKTTNKNRETEIFVHSNDGVMHALRDSTAMVPPSWVGEERYGFVPRQSQPFLYQRLSGHRFIADGSFGSADVCFGQGDCEKADGTGWMSILVGSLGRGGPFLYALDITDPTAGVKWLWDVNPDSTDYPDNLDEPHLGIATSPPVVARVMVESDPYKWGVFVGGGLYDPTIDGWANNDCNDDSWGFYHEVENGNYFYVFDADPSTNTGTPAVVKKPLHQTAGSKSARYCVRGINEDTWGNVANNSIPGRPGVLRPDNNSRAQVVYFGDTDGKLNRMDVTSTDMRDWQPYTWFTPFKHNRDQTNHFTVSRPGLPTDPGANCNLLSGSAIPPMPDIPGLPAARTVPLARPDSTSDGMAPIWQRPYRFQNQNTGLDVLYVGTGDPTNFGASAASYHNYFYAIEDQTSMGAGNKCPALLRWAYYLDDGQSVLSDPVVVGNNILVPVYVPPGGASGCGATGYSKIYCFDRLSGAPQSCLTSNSVNLGNNIDSGHIDDPSPVSGLHKWVLAGAGMMSDLTAVGNSIVYNTSVDPTKIQQKSVPNVSLPFHIRSWRRLR